MENQEIEEDGGKPEPDEKAELLNPCGDRWRMEIGVEGLMIGFEDLYIQCLNSFVDENTLVIISKFRHRGPRQYKDKNRPIKLDSFLIFYEILRL